MFYEIISWLEIKHNKKKIYERVIFTLFCSCFEYKCLIFHIKHALKNL